MYGIESVTEGFLWTLACMLDHKAQYCGGKPSSKEPLPAGPSVSSWWDSHFRDLFLWYFGIVLVYYAKVVDVFGSVSSWMWRYHSWVKPCQAVNSFLLRDAWGSGRLRYCTAEGTAVFADDAMEKKLQMEWQQFQGSQDQNRSIWIKMDQHGSNIKIPRYIKVFQPAFGGISDTACLWQPVFASERNRRNFGRLLIFSLT